MSHIEIGMSETRVSNSGEGESSYGHEFNPVERVGYLVVT